MKIDQPILEFQDVSLWQTWLTANHENTAGIWLRFFKKGSGIASVTYDQALDVALCFGWIDGQLRKYDDTSWLRKFTPRRPRSIWSKRNIEHVERLTAEGKMQPSGIREVEAAKKDGRWSDAYDPPSNAQIPEDFLAVLNKSEKAKKMFDTLNKANLYAITWRLQTAKTAATRTKRIAAIVDMLASGEKFH